MTGMKPMRRCAPAMGLCVLTIVTATRSESVSRGPVAADSGETRGWVDERRLESSGGFPASGVSLISNVTLPQMSAAAGFNVGDGNDIWGYVSPSGREYAIMGLQIGTAFIEVSDPYNPVIVAVKSDANSIWSDMKTYGRYAYNVNESGGGMQVFDLLNIDNGVITQAGSLTGGLSTSHNLALNPDSGYAYLCGSNIGGGRLVAVSLANPRAPVIAGQALDGAYVHDAQIVSYTSGPYAGREIAFMFCGSSGFKIVDVTSKSNMFTMATRSYPGLEYCHQGWLSEDRRHVFIDDELDELNQPPSYTTKTFVFNVEDLSNPTYVGNFFSDQTTIDHNLIVRGNHVFEANYTSGLRVFDVTDPANAQYVGYFDTYPTNNARQFQGAWGVYPLLPSGVVLVSDIDNGLFVLDASVAIGEPCELVFSARPSAPVTVKNRYLSVEPSNAGKQTYLEIGISDLPPAFDGLEGEVRYAGPPETIMTPGGPVTRSSLQCDPHIMDWGAVGTVHLYGKEVMPGGAYTVRVVLGDCGDGQAASAMAALSATTVWGDVVGGTGGVSAPDGVTNFIDISSVVSCFTGSLASPGVVRCDLHPEVPDLVVDFQDISAAVGAFSVGVYPFAGPSSCP